MNIQRFLCFHSVHVLSPSNCHFTKKSHLTFQDTPLPAKKPKKKRRSDSPAFVDRSESKRSSVVVSSEPTERSTDKKSRISNKSLNKSSSSSVHSLSEPNHKRGKSRDPRSYSRERNNRSKDSTSTRSKPQSHRSRSRQRPSRTGRSSRSPDHHSRKDSHSRPAERLSRRRPSSRPSRDDSSGRYKRNRDLSHEKSHSHSKKRSLVENSIASDKTEYAHEISPDSEPAQRLHSKQASNSNAIKQM